MTDVPGAIAQSALDAAGGDAAVALQHARAAVKVLARWKVLQIIDEGSEPPLAEVD